MTQPEAYGAFAWAYDQPLGKTFFAAVSPLLDRILAKYPTAERTHLDLACGTGLAMEYFERKGFRSAGLDASLPMLGVARERTRHLAAGDLRDLPLAGHFARITCLYDSLNHLLDRTDLTRAFRSVAGLMNQGSLYLFDMNHPDAYEDVWSIPEPFESEGSDYHLTIHTTYSRWRRLGIGRVNGWSSLDGRRYPIAEIRRQRAYSKRNILKALTAAGLEPVEVFPFSPFVSDRNYHLRKAKWLFVVRRAA